MVRKMVDLSTVASAASKSAKLNAREKSSIFFINVKKFNWKKIVAPIAMLVIGLLGGLLGAFILLTAAGVSFTNSTDTGVKTAKTVYNNTTDTTKAVKKVQNAVVSVINYQEGSSSDSLNELYGRIFGGDDSSDSSQDKSKDSDGLQVAGEGSGVIYKKDGKEAYIVTNNHVVDGAKKLEIMLSWSTSTLH